MLDIKLATLLTVAKEKNFTKAAEKLSLTQPAVSHHIGQLEDELGTRIFVRAKTGLRLTPEGEIVLRYAERLRSLYDKMGVKRQRTPYDKDPRRHYTHGGKQLDHRNSCQIRCPRR